MYKKFSLGINERHALEEIGYGLPEDPNIWGDGLLMPAFCEFFTLDPKTIFEQVKCPVLVLNGEKDLQVPPNKHLSAIGTALHEGGNLDYTIKKIPGLNHLLQKCRTGSPIEYEQIQETISPKALQIIKEWIFKQIK